MKESRLVVGLMTGTSLDGVDAALVEIIGSGLLTQIKLKYFYSVPFDSKVRDQLLRVASGRLVSAQVISHLNFLLGILYSEAVFKLCKGARIDLHQLDLIGSHGQTIFHQSEPSVFCGRKIASTLQIGEPSFLAENTGVTTISDFRPRDMAAGGKGAPLIPYVDYILFRDLRQGRVLLNIGGIANVTSIPASPKIIQVRAFDTGPGNMPIDIVVRRFTQNEKKFDHRGEIARSGKVIPTLLEDLLADPYFALKPPKTAGREQFGEHFTSKLLDQDGSRCFEDLVCTATEVTAQSVARAITELVLPQAHIDQLIISGGGAYNDFLLQRLRALLPQLEVLRSDDFGIPANAKEAVGFAILANETLNLHSGNIPSATGARHPVVLGKVVCGNNYKRLRGIVKS
ncbi:MAG: anhydro-N-acetylmuramic acid kinase [Acidobacteria bacterium]|nr:MAG: anhydro-N-acetylmuramic acid kinase [Acidobacteriota bacterium]